jgi:hypothetical protein
MTTIEQSKKSTRANIFVLQSQLDLETSKSAKQRDTYRIKILKNNLTIAERTLKNWEQR